MIGAPGKREEQPVHQLDAAPVVAQKRRKPAPDAQVDPRLQRPERTRGTCSPGPRPSPSPASARRGCAGRRPTGSRRVSAASAAGCRSTGKRSSMCTAMNSRGISGKWNAMWHSSPVAEVGDGVLRPLVRFRQKHAVREMLVHVPPQVCEGNHASLAGSRSSCLRAHTDKGRHPGAAHRHPCPTSSRAPGGEHAAYSGFSKFRSG